MSAQAITLACLDVFGNDEPDFHRAARILRTRIGGSEPLALYAQCPVAGNSLKEGKP